MTGIDAQIFKNVLCIVNLLPIVSLQYINYVEKYGAHGNYFAMSKELCEILRF